MGDRNWRQPKVKQVQKQAQKQAVVMRYRIQQYSDKHLLQNSGNSHPNPQGRHHEGQASCRLGRLTRGGEGLHLKTQTRTSEDLQASLLDLGDLVSRMIRCVVAADRTQGMINAGHRPSTPTRTRTLRLCHLYDRSRPWNKAFAHDQVAKV